MVWRANPRMKAFSKRLVLTEVDKQIIYELKDIEPLDLKAVDDELLLSVGLCRFLVGSSCPTCDVSPSFLYYPFLFFFPTLTQ